MMMHGLANAKLVVKLHSRELIHTDFCMTKPS